MREIKFRAWDRDKKQWIYHFNVRPLGLVVNLAGDEYLNCELVQFTGLKDKNGREIYEGDVVFHSSDNWEVAYVGESFGVTRAAFMLNTWNAMGMHTFKGMPETDMEVIGDIYSTPELLAS
jgi:uncharacterized phage protein (TIGR01671 family)